MEKDVVLNEEIIDKKVLRCYYNICRYYNKEKKIIEKYKRRLPKIYPN